MFFIDREARKILELFPTRAVRVVNKAALMKPALQALAQMANGVATSNAAAATRDALTIPGLLVGELPESGAWASRHEISAAHGEILLKIYFAQIYADREVHIDLRPRYFADSPEGALVWKPSALRFRFDTEFRLGMQELYESFYFERKDRFESSLEKIGLLRRDLSEKRRQSLIQVFYDHFGAGQTQPVSFDTAGLRESFDIIFAVLEENDIRINPQFAFLGAMLSTLYTSLEKSRQPLDVRAAFLSVAKA